VMHDYSYIHLILSLHLQLVKYDLFDALIICLKE
jgi:hypothetical protein